MIEICHRETGALLLRVQGRTLAGADLHHVDLRHAFLDGGNLEGSNLREADLRCISLRGANLRQSHLEEAMCTDADLAGAVLCGASLKCTKLVGARLTGADLTEADLESAILRTASLAGAKLRRTNLRGIDLAWAKLHGASLIEVDLSGASLVHAELRGIDLQAVNLESADLGEEPAAFWTVPIPRLAGATYDANTRWPAGFDPRQWGALPSDEPRQIPQIRYPPADPDELARRNRETWRHVVARYEELARRWPRLMPMLRLVRQIAASHRARFFRAGLSLYALLISTKAEHRLDPGDSWVVVRAEPEHRFPVSYIKGSPQACEECECGESELMPTLTPLLDRLWTDTRG